VGFRVKGVGVIGRPPRPARNPQSEGPWGLRRVLIRDHADRDAIAVQLMRYRDENGQGWADVIDFLTMYPDARRQVVRWLGEIDAR
jgi:hypothetical protein